ncbi:MAG: hypothetical protein KDI34_15960 [Halioglobus sp.]|nr:hypothetical protein [Halioglobus sp.]
MIGSIRRECLNHVIIFNERHLRGQLKSYSTYYHEASTHLSLDKQSPVPRSIEPPDQGNVVAIPHVGGPITSTGAQLDFSFGRTARRIKRRGF